MFTGIIQTTGRVERVEVTPAGLRLEVDPGGWAVRTEVGDSVAVNGCCLTLAAERAVSGERLAFDVIPETLSKTTLGGWKAGRRVHLEPAATLSTFLGGHLVQGHVDAVGEVVANGTEPGGGWSLRLRYPRVLNEFLVAQGSVCVDGVSLTIAGLETSTRELRVALIPTTLEKTTLGGLRPGDGVNLEADVIAKQVAAYLRLRDGGV